METPNDPIQTSVIWLRPVVLYILLFTAYSLQRCNPIEDLDPLSFARVELVTPEIIESNNEIIIRAVLLDIEAEDPIQAKGHLVALDSALVSGPSPDLQDYRVKKLLDDSPSQNGQYRSILKINEDGYVPGVKYYYRAFVIRSERLGGTIDFSPGPPAVGEIPLAVVTTDDIRESDKTLTLTAFSTIKNPNNQVILSAGHYWFGVNAAGDTISRDTTTSSTLQPNSFSSELFNYDFSTTYHVKAFLVLDSDPNRPIPESTSPLKSITSTSEGDFWVELFDLANNVDQHLKENLKREGAISFVIKGIIYIGLGRQFDPSTGDAVYPTNFWGYDPRKNTWTEYVGFNDLGLDLGRMHAAVVVHDNKAYFGTGCRACPTNLTAGIAGDSTQLFQDLYVFNPLANPPSWTALGDLKDNTDSDRDRKEVTEADGDADDKGRFGAIMYIQNNRIRLSGGVGKRIRKKEEGSLEPGDWIDYNNNKLIDINEPVMEENGQVTYTDHNNNGQRDKINPGVNCGIKTIGDLLTEWVDDGNDPDPDSKNWNDCINLGSIDNLPEWIASDGNYSHILDSDVTYEYLIKDDVWEFNPSGSNAWTPAGNLDFQRYGAAVVTKGEETLLVQGLASLPGSTQMDINWQLHSNNAWMAIEPAQPPVAYPAAFQIDGILYFGGGANADGTIRSFDINIATPFASAGNPPAFDVSRCGFAALSNGISLSYGRKGYVGLGRINETGRLTNNIWIYVPARH